MLKLKLQYLATWCKELTHWKDPDAGKDWRLPGSSVTRVQGYPQDEQHWWKNDTGRPSLGEVRPITLFFKGAFIPWLVHRGKWKVQSHVESAQTLQQFCPYRNQDFFLHIFPINKGLMLCTLSSSLGGLLTFYDPFLIKVDQPENLFSLEVFFPLYL